MSASSTSAMGHIGTGVGVHGPGWVHYQNPQGASLRVVHTKYDYADANQKITAAVATSGSVAVNATVFDKVTRWRCGNGSCGATNASSSIPARSGCTVARTGWHTWVRVTLWVARAPTTRTLYYNKSGATTQVSMHSTP